MTLALSILLACLWLVLACVFAGVGALVLGERGGLDDGWPAVHAAFWTGVATVTCGLLAWHLLLPVDGVALSVLIAVGLTGCVRGRRMFAACLRTRPAWPMSVVIAALALWVANHSLDSAAIDDYLYEFQAVRWNHDFAIVPGLANLHGRLGFNESHHLLGALFSVGPLAGNVNHVINGLFVTVLILYLAAGLEQLLRGAPARGSILLRSLLAGPAVSLGLFSYYGSTISTLKADVLVTCCVVLLVCLLIEFAETEYGTTHFARAATVLLLVSGLAMTVKLSAVVFCAVLGVGICGRLALEARRRRRRLDRLIWAGLTLSVAMVCLVPLRGVVLSGYPAYPATVFSAKVDWRVPEAQADAERAIITSWARLHPSYDPRQLRGWGWLGNWTRDTVLSAQFAVVLPLALTLMCIAAALVPSRDRARSLVQSPTWAYVTLLVACAAALGVWWLEAPASRFASGLFWGIAATSLAWTFERRTWSIPALVVAGIVAVAGLAVSLAAIGMAPGSRGVIVLFTGALAWTTALAVRGRRSGTELAVLCIALALAETADRMASFLVHERAGDARAVLWLTPERYMDDRRTGYPIVARKTLSGLTVYVTGSTQFDTPIPNTRYFNPYLELRRAGSLSSGFRARLPIDVAGYGYSINADRTARPASTIDPSLAHAAAAGR